MIEPYDRVRYGAHEGATVATARASLGSGGVTGLSWSCGKYAVAVAEQQQRERGSG